VTPYQLERTLDGVKQVCERVIIGELAQGASPPRPGTLLEVGGDRRPLGLREGSAAPVR
jgi:hypothetical protein